jgi:putative peptide zinc metalloprotease protein
VISQQQPVVDQAGAALGSPRCLLPGAELLGQAEGSGLREPPYLIRRPDGQVVQVSRLLYLVARYAEPNRDLAEVGRLAGGEMELRITADQVRYLLDEKLHPLGVVSGPDGSLPRLERVQPLFGLRHRVGVIRPAAVRWIGRVFSPLFLPPVMAAVLAGLLAFDVWLATSHGIGRGLSYVIQKPSLALLLFFLAYASLAFHEFGHAAACRYGGGKPGAIGVGVYVVWPVFYTDVTDSYRFSKRGRLRTDLGGVYFNGIFALALAGLYLATGFEPLLLAVLSQHLLVFDQFLPWLRLDGYYVVADLVGVADLFARIRPVVRTLMPGRRPDPRVDELKPWARRAVKIWVVTTVLALAGGATLLFANAARYVDSAWQSLHFQAQLVGEGVRSSDAFMALASGIDVVMLLLPVAGFLLTYLMLCRGAGSALAVSRARRAVRRRGRRRLKVAKVSPSGAYAGARTRVTLRAKR